MRILKNFYRPLSFLIVFIITHIFFPFLDIFIFPGIFIIFWKNKELPELVVYGLGISLAFWVVSFNFLHFFNIGLSAWIRISIVFFKILFICVFEKFSRISEWPWIKIDRRAAICVALLAYVFILRLFILKFLIAPSGADMSMHSYMARLIYENNGMPISHEPILPIKSFGAVSYGFSVLIAIFSILAHTPVYKSAIVITGIAYAALTLGVYVFLERFTKSKKYSFIIAILITFFTVHPQALVRQGGNSFVFSFFFTTLVIVFVSYFFEAGMPFWIVPVSALFFFTAVLIHPILPVSTGAIGGLILIVYFLIKKQHCAIFCRRTVFFIIMIFLLICPHFLNLKIDLSVKEINWIFKLEKQFIRLPDKITPGNLVFILRETSFYIMRYFGGIIDYLGVSNALIVYICGLMIIFVSNPLAGFLSILSCGLVMTALINSNYWFLPASYFLYPDRMALLYILPLALSASYLFEFFMGILKKVYLRAIVISAILLFSFFLNQAHYINVSCQDTTVTKSDLAAFKWIEKNTKAESVFQNSYGDAGLWIPVIAYRKILSPHINVVYMDEFNEGAKGISPDYVYLGKKSVYGSSFTRQDFEKAKKDYIEVYLKDGVEIYKRRESQ